LGGGAGRPGWTKDKRILVYAGRAGDMTFGGAFSVLVGRRRSMLPCGGGRLALPIVSFPLTAPHTHTHPHYTRTLSMHSVPRGRCYLSPAFTIPVSPIQPLIIL
jgi:hypothetical protein